MSDIPSQIFEAFVSAVKNQSTGVLKIQSDKALRLFMFSKGLCLDVGSNVKEELPGTFLFQQKVLSEAQYQTYLQKCFTPKTNQWLLANTEIQLQPTALLDKRRQHAIGILSRLKINEVTSVQFQSLPNLPSDQAVLEPIEIFLLLANRYPLIQVKKLKPELDDVSTRVSIVKEPEKFQLDDDQAGLMTVIQHNATFSEVLDSSFLDKEKIYQWMIAFEAAGIIRIESPTESDRRKFIDSLKDEQKKNRALLKKEFQNLTNKTFYEALQIDSGADAEDVQHAFDSQKTLFSDKKYQGLFFHKEENLTHLILERITQAFNVLSNPEKRKEYDQFINKGSTESFSDQSQTILEEKLIADINEIIAARKFDDAIKFLEEKLTKYPHFLKLYTILVDLIRELKMFDNEQLNQKIFILFKEGISKSPHEPQFFVLLGEWCLLLSQKSNALKAFQKALNIRAGSKKIRDYVMQLDPESGKQIIVEAVYQNLETLNHFEMMGLEPTANEKEIRTIYRDVSKHFHPDRFFNSNNQTLKEMSKRVFKEMVASYLVLKDEVKRKEYLEHLFSSQRKKEEKTKATLPKSPQARRYYDQAVLFLEENNLSSAKLNIQLAVSYEPENYLLQKMLKEIKTKLSGSIG
jgi:curved DNA-binding protein CbpA